MRQQASQRRAALVAVDAPRGALDGEFRSCREGEAAQGRAGVEPLATPASSKVKSRVNSVRPALTAQRGGIQVPVSRPKSRLMRYVLPERDSARAAATTPASRRSDMVCEGCGLTGRQRGVFNHHTALWGRPVGIAASPLEPGARRGEPTNRTPGASHQ